MPNLTKLVSGRMTASVDLSTLGAEAIHIEYYLARVTTETLLAVSEIDNISSLPPERQREVIASLPDLALGLLAGWDLTETDPESGAETPLPIDHAHLDALGYIILSLILRTMLSAKGEVSALGASVSAPASSAN